MCYAHEVADPEANLAIPIWSVNGSPPAGKVPVSKKALKLMSEDCFYMVD